MDRLRKLTVNKEILKRLEIIKSAISIEEIELIDLQVQKLESLPVDEDVNAIIQLIKSKCFEDVIQKIDHYNANNTGLTRYEDPQIQGLKLELRYLENHLNSLLDEKADYEQKINTFNTQYLLKLGSLLSGILKLQQELAEDNSLEKENIRKEYEEFHKSYQELVEKPAHELDEDQKKELKRAYRKASHLCHPDKLTGEYKIKGEEYFAALTGAYRNQDLKKVLEILGKLESGKHLEVASDTESDKAKLLEQIKYLKNRISSMELEIESIKQSDTFTTILEITDLDEYLSHLEIELTKELEHLQMSVKSRQ